MDLILWKQKIAALYDQSVEYDPHLIKRMLERGIPLMEINYHLENPKKLYRVQEYEDQGLRLFFDYDEKENLIIGLQLLKKGLYIKTVFFRRKYR